jgi:hypothetical protein
MHAGRVRFSAAPYGAKVLFDAPDHLTDLRNVVAYRCRQLFQESAPWTGWKRRRTPAMRLHMLARGHLQRFRRFTYEQRRLFARRRCCVAQPTPRDCLHRLGGCRYRLWRSRNEPALHLPDHRQLGRRPCLGPCRHGAAVSRCVGAHHHGFAKILPVRHARRQPWRRRHPGPHGLGHAPGGGARARWLSWDCSGRP